MFKGVKSFLHDSKISCTVATGMAPNDIWNILQHLACKTVPTRCKTSK